MIASVRTLVPNKVMFFGTRDKDKVSEGNAGQLLTVHSLAPQIRVLPVCKIPSPNALQSTNHPRINSKSEISSVLLHSKT